MYAFTIRQPVVCKSVNKDLYLFLSLHGCKSWMGKKGLILGFHQTSSINFDTLVATLLFLSIHMNSNSPIFLRISWGSIFFSVVDPALWVAEALITVQRMLSWMMNLRKITVQLTYLGNQPCRKIGPYLVLAPNGQLMHSAPTYLLVSGFILNPHTRVKYC